MRFLSVCSGIEAASVAWSPLGWRAVAFSEIEPFPCALLAHHYPNVPNLGDMTKFKEWPDYAIDLLCGGTPCQSFSVAGLRKGLDDPRGNLMLTFGAIAAKYRPQWLVWENVPGVLSSNGGRDFGSFLGMLGQLGYGFAYRIHDAQFHGVAQRRRRVFVVGCLGDWRSAAAVLFERHSLQGHPAPSREAGQAVTPTIRAGAANGGAGHGARSGDSKDELIVPVAKTLHGQPNASNREDTDTYIPVAGTLCVATGQAGAEIGADMAPTLNCNHEAPYVAGALCKASFSGGAGGRPEGAAAGHFVPVAFPANLSGTQCAATEDLAPSMGASNPTAVAIFQGENYGRMDGGTPQGSNDLPGGAMRSMRSAGCGSASQERRLARPHAEQSTAPMPQLPHEGPSFGEAVPPVQSTTQRAGLLREALPAVQEVGQPGVGEGESGNTTNARGRNDSIEGVFGGGLRFSDAREGLLQQARTTGQEGDIGPNPTYQKRGGYAPMAVRRLTPEECEKLQGFPVGYTDIRPKGKPTADGNRYKALGNSWAVPNVTWIGRRIDSVNSIRLQSQKQEFRIEEAGMQPSPVNDERERALLGS